VRAVYDVRHSYPDRDCVDLTTYAGTEMLVPCRTVRIDAVLDIPDRLRGKRLRAKVVLEEARR